MKKALRIVLYSLGSILLLIALLLVFHNAIISFALKTAIKSKSEGKVILKLRDFDFNLVSGSILISDPELVMKELYLSETKNMSLDKVVFDKIEIDLLDLKLLISDRDILARNFLIDKPVFWFTEKGTSIQSSFHPDKLFEALSYNPGLFKALQVKIDDIEIHYGSINISEHSAKELDPGVVDFTILLHDFNTSAAKDTSQNRILFSEELLFRLKDLNRTLKSGYTLKIDSAVFSTKKRDLEIGGAELIPGIENLKYNAVGVYAGQLRLTDIGLEEVRGMEDLSLSAIHVSDGHFTSYQKGQSAAKDTSDNSATLESLQKLFYDFILDSITIQRFEFYNIDKNSDTTIDADNINFLITGIEIDSGMFDDPFRNFLYDTIKFSTGNLELNNLVPGYKINYHGLDYSNKDKILSISGVGVKSDSSAGSDDQVEIMLRKLDLKGFSLKHFQKEQVQHLTITVDHPEINLDFAELKNRKKSSKAPFYPPQHLQLEKVILLNGNINMVIEDQVNVAIKGLNVDVEEFRFPDQTDTNFRYQNLTFNYENLIAQIQNKKHQLVTGELSYKDQELVLKNLNGSFTSGNIDQVGQFKTSYLKLQKFNLHDLLFKKELRLSTLQIVEPFVSGTISLKSKRDTIEHGSEPGSVGIPLTFKIDSVRFSEGGVDALFELKNDQLKVVSDYDLSVGKIAAQKGDSFKSLLEKLLWSAQLGRAKFEFQDHAISLKSLQSNSLRSDLRIDSLSVLSLSNKDSLFNKLKLREVDIPYLKIKGLDYKLLMLEDSLKLGSFTVADARFNVILPKTKRSRPLNPNHKIDLRQFLFLSYDTISLANLQLNIEHPADTAYIFYGLKKFDFTHVRKKHPDLNLIKNLGFEFDSFSYSDSISGSYFTIKKGSVDSNELNFIIEDIESGIKPAKHARALQKSKSILQYSSSEIDLQNVFIKDDLPSAIRIGEIYVGNLNLDYIKSNSEVTEKAPFKLDLTFLKRYTKVMSSLQVDTTNLNDISISYRDNKDTIAQNFKVENVALIVDQLNIDTAMAEQAEPRLIKRLTVDLRGRTYITKDSLYEIRTGRLYYDFPGRMATIDTLYVTPRYPDAEFFEKAVFQTDKTTLFARKIEINKIDIDALLNKNYLHFGNVNFYEIDARMYRNKFYEIKPGSYKPLPREALMAINQKFAIDTFSVFNSHLEYKQLDPKSERPGTIFLSDFNIDAFNITNKLEEGDHESRIKVNLDAKIMGESKMEFTLFFPLYEDSTAFWLSGKTEEIDMVKLNQITENLMGIGITDGVGSVEVPLISGNDSIAYGSLLFKYKKLRLALYNREKEELNSSFFSPVVNFFINDLVLRSNNPRFARRTKTGVVYFKRDTRKGIVNYTFKSLLSGMLSTLGINNKGQRQEKKDMKEKP